jgi:DNA-binding CsgD family transcriptional regulator
VRRVPNPLNSNAEPGAVKIPRVDGTLPHNTPAGASLLSEVAWAEVARSLKLSAREVEIIQAVFDNLKEDAIAVNLGSSEHTIHTHLHRLFGKLRVTTRAQMVVRIVQELLILTLSEGSSLPSICRRRANGRCPMQD